MHTSKFAGVLLLALTSLSAHALTPQEEYDSYKRHIRAQSAAGQLNYVQEKAAVDFAYNIYRTTTDHPWTWWFYTDDFGKPVAPGTIDYNAILGPAPVTIQSNAYTSAGASMVSLPTELAAAGFAGVRYDVEYGNGVWHTIGVSSDAATGYGLTYVIDGFEPIFRAVPVDGLGHGISVFDSAGNDVATAEVLAVAVPEPGTWLLLIGGLGLLPLVLRRPAGSTVLSAR